MFNSSGEWGGIWRRSKETQKLYNKLKKKKHKLSGNWTGLTVYYTIIFHNLYGNGAILKKIFLIEILPICAFGICFGHRLMIRCTYGSYYYFVPYLILVVLCARHKCIVVWLKLSAAQCRFWLFQSIHLFKTFHKKRLTKKLCSFCFDDHRTVNFLFTVYHTGFSKSQNMHTRTHKYTMHHEYATHKLRVN